MRRALLTVLLVLAGLTAIGALAGSPGAPGPVSAVAAPPPAGCAELTPEQAGAPARPCRDYLFQIHCQFSSSVGDEEVWEDWCRDREGLEEGGSPEVPKCGLKLAAQPTEVGERCRDYLAATRCFGGTTSEQEMEDFCANVAPKAGPDPRPRTCDTDLAYEHSAEGDACWERLKREYCSGWQAGDNTGAEDLNQLCEAAAKGPKPAEPPAEDEAEQSPPAEEAPAEKEEGADPSQGSPNVLLQLGREPACDKPEELNEEVQRACALSGSVMHTYPFANYGIDNNVSVDVLDDDFWSGETPIMSLFQWLIVAVWQGLLWLLKISLLLVQWAFGVDPLSRSLEGVRSSAMGFFELLDPEWRLTALAVLGTWVFWNGLVRMRFMQTLAGMLASLALMIGAMWIAFDPEGTVGKVAKYANDSALVMLSATSSGELQKPRQGVAETQRTVFDQMIVGPWCALQFGGLAACEEKTADGTMTRAQLWLSLPANSSARGVLYKATKEGPAAIEDETDENVVGDFFDALGDGLCMYSAGLINTCEGDEDVTKSQTQQDREENPEEARQFDEAKASAAKLIKENPGAVKLQGSDGVFTRAGLLAVIAIGMIGAVAFFFAIGVRLLTAGVIVLLLILLAPVMMVVAAFGEEGRRRSLSWLRMLAGAALAKLVYSVLLGLVLLVVGILSDANVSSVAGLLFPAQAFADEPEGAASGSADWLGNWLLVSAFLWVAVLQMNRVLALFAPDPGSEQSGGLGAGAALFLGQRMVSQTMRGAWEGATFLPRKLGPRAVNLARRERAIRREGTDAAIREQAGGLLDNRAQDASRREFDEQGLQADRTLKAGRASAAAERLGRINQELERSTDPLRREKLERRKAFAERDLNRHREAERRARAQKEKEFKGLGAAGERAQRRQREDDVSRWKRDPDSWSSENNRRWAGISDSRWEQAKRAAENGNSAPMDRLRARSEAALNRDVELFARNDDSKPFSRETRKEALKDWGGSRYDPPRRGAPYRPADPDFAERRREERSNVRRRGRENVRRRWL